MKRIFLLSAFWFLILSTILGGDSFYYNHFYYRILDDHPNCVEVRLFNDNRYLENGLEDSTVVDLIKYEDGSSAAFIPETVYDSDGKAYSVISIWGESAPKPALHAGWLRTGAFQDNYIPDTIYLPKTIVWIGTYAFYSIYEFEDLKRVYLPEGIGHIGAYAFSNRQQIDSISLPNSLKHVEVGLFSGCKGLRYVSLPDQLESIGNSSFLKCSSLEGLEIPANVTIIGNSCFEGSGLKKLVLPPDATIGAGLFKDCFSLESVELPVTLEKLPDETFLNCQSLTDGMKLPESLLSIGQKAFYGSSLLSITLPQSLQVIGASAFNGCPLTSITFPRTLQSIDAEAFGGCDYLRSITLESPEPPVVADKNAFSNYNALLYVPRASIEKYATSPIWCLFRDIVSIEEKPVYYRVSFMLPYGCIEQEVLQGEKLTLHFTPDDGYVVHSVTYNGRDVTQQLNPDNSFKTPAITDDAKVAVVYESNADGIESKDADSAIKVYAVDDHISVSGVNDGTMLKLYNAEGKLVKTIHADHEGHATFDISEGGIYILSTPAKSFKLCL